MKGREETRTVSASHRRVSLSHLSIRYGILRVTPWSWRCKLYCNGANCKYCSWKPWPLKEQAIRGLYSSWITGKIVAMSRPTAKTFTDDNLVAQFHKANICAVINLQMLGEHDSCGPKLLPSGFTYNPEMLMQNGIQFYNFIWPDFGALGIDILLDIVKVVHCSLRQGLGRTGVVIAAYMIWAKHCTYAEAIGRVRTARPHSVQNKKQIRLVKDFGTFLEKSGAALPQVATYLGDYMHMQVKILSSSQARKYHHIPKEIDICICGLLENYSGILDSDGKGSKIVRNDSFQMTNCKKFIRTNFRGNTLLLLQTLDQLMNSFIKPIIPEEELRGNIRYYSEHADWQCLHRYLLITMASISNGNYRNIAKLISRWYLGESVNDDGIIVTLQNHLVRDHVNFPPLLMSLAFRKSIKEPYDYDSQLAS
uniref:Tyrosine specific protein phosphatases domain-containing protein n=1 Tax=Setaria digitata TaxID=48799 RepID=A0A915PLI6_9BILA